MRVLIQPFEQVGGWIGWEGEGKRYVWGESSVALGKHFDSYNDSSEWQERLDTLEAELMEVAAAATGHDVRLAPEYI